MSNALRLENDSLKTFFPTLEFQVLKTKNLFKYLCMIVHFRQKIQMHVAASYIAGHKVTKMIEVPRSIVLLLFHLDDIVSVTLFGTTLPTKNDFALSPVSINMKITVWIQIQSLY